MYAFTMLSSTQYGPSVSDSSSVQLVVEEEEEEYDNNDEGLELGIKGDNSWTWVVVWLGTKRGDLDASFNVAITKNRKKNSTTTPIF